MPWVVDQIAEYDKEFGENARRFYATNVARCNMQDAKKDIIKSSVVTGVASLVTTACVYGYDFCSKLESSDLACIGSVGTICGAVIGGLFGISGLVFLAGSIKTYLDNDKTFRKECRRK